MAIKSRSPETQTPIVRDSDITISDITTNNFSTAAHGFAPKGSTDTAKFLRADGTFEVGFDLVCQGRLTLTTGNPVTTADVTAAANIFFTPYGGNRLALYTSSLWKLYTFTEVTLAVGTLTNDLPYDIFIFDSAGVVTMESVAWTNKTTRATALTTQDGVYVKSGSTNKRYLGTFHTTSTTTTEDSFAKRFLWNYYNRVVRPMRVTEATNTWNYTTATIRQANGSTANQIAFVIGVAEIAVEALATVIVFNASAEGGVVWAIGIGDNTTSAFTTGYIGGYANNEANNAYQQLVTTLRLMPAVGHHFWSWNEYSSAVGTSTWGGDANDPTHAQSGIHGELMG